jgi:hypothetical protein
MVKLLGMHKDAFKDIPIFPSIPKAFSRLAKWHRL